jgi:pilus assembly protein CpaD
MTKLRTSIVGHRHRAVPRLLAVCGLAAMLAGCYESRLAQNEYPDDYRQRHPITLKEGERTVEIFIGRNRGGLTASQRADVLSFAQQWRHDATSGIIVDVPHGGPINHAATDSMRETLSILTASGVPRRAVYVRKYRLPAASVATIKISYAQIMADAGPCGRWPYDMGPAGGKVYNSNKPYWNFGCANQRNLAAMVDNPADLVQPRGEQPAYEARRSVALEKYRKGEIPSGKYDGFEKGKISDVGK